MNIFRDDFVFKVGSTDVSLIAILSAIFWIALMVIASVWFSRWIEKRLLKLEHIDLSLRMVVAKIIRTLLMALSVLIALPIVGIDLSVLSVFGGALGVGLGFGLQKIASNYLSGLIILMDRSIRIGDRLVIDGRTGYVTKITSRYTVLRAPDGTEALIPNDLLVSHTVINQSYSDATLWQSIPVQVAYETDLHMALKLLSSTVTSHSRIATEPKPNAFVKGFGESGIDLELAFWVIDPDQGLLALRSEINLLIWQVFSEHGIKIPYPRRDVYAHIQTTRVSSGSGS